ncbi:hypothetical protein EC957_002020 [Mortierella hygrophila]|uniref:Uncharacterized protein n=1 Tax=Mortierella hygrophila TaxID=979708 RepID=A0A9P6K7J2_9FUNG|nr:hypothetical protein EC957_002020 [Mortierella hygrophila]
MSKKSVESADTDGSDPDTVKKPAKKRVQRYREPNGSTVQESLETYHVGRIVHGVPEGIDAFIAGTSLSLECNLEYINGVEF